MNIAMNIDRKMVSLFFEIKQNMPFEDRDDMKLSAPNLAKQLIRIYQTTDSPKVKSLIERFMLQADKDWTKQLKRQFSIIKN